MPDMTTRDYIHGTIVGVIADIQRNAGREVPQITDETVPFDHVIGFDSVCGVEAAVLISERLAVEIEQIPFVSPTGGHHTKVREIVDMLVISHGHRIVAGTVSASVTNASATGRPQ